MNKRLVFIALPVLAIGAITALLIKRHFDQTSIGAFTEKHLYKARMNMGGVEATATPTAAPAPLDPKRRVRLALGNLGMVDEASNGQLNDLITADLSHEKNLELVERQSLQKVLHELDLSASGLVRAKDAVRAGKLLRADWFLLGSQSTANGSNATVVRIVDARTGVMRDAGVFTQTGNITLLGTDLASFAREARKTASSWKPKTYLAIGIFQDLSVNNRQAELPRELRAYLTAAYQHTNVTLLE